MDLELLFAGQHFSLLPERGAYWSERQTLLVADLHLGKAETFQAFGVPVPSGHAADDLSRLHALCRRVSARKIVILGDLLHSSVGLGDVLIGQIAGELRGLDGEVALVLGNHDRAAGRVAEAAGIAVAERLEWGAVLLSHKPEVKEGVFNICGHVHPRAVLRLEFERLKLPCFVAEPGRLTLPAFGRFTGGADVGRAPRRRRFVSVEGAVVALDDSFRQAR